MLSSLSARRAWIEIPLETLVILPKQVALRKESVDRNVNLRVLDGSKSSVALRKESVDRNTSVVSSAGTTGKSLSARRAWIEILFCPSFMPSQKLSLSARLSLIHI